jgi:O-methyltransferase
MFANALKKLSPNPKARRKAYWHSVKSICKKYNFEYYKPNLIWINDEDFKAAQKEWPREFGMSNDRRFFLYNTAKRLRNIPGDSADVGVRFGSSSFFINKGLNDPSRTHHLFDSFEGLSEPTAEDHDKKSKVTAWKKGDICVEEAVTRKNLSMFNNCEFHKGWVPDRFPDVANKKFVFVHIDVDLYQPTLDSLKFFYDRVNPGGVIICDDYGFSSCPGAKQAMEEFFADKKETLFYIPTGQAMIIKQ